LRVATTLRHEDHQRKLRQLASRRKAIEAQITALQAEAEAESEEVHFAITQESMQARTLQQNHDAMSQQRGAIHAANGIDAATPAATP
jgi:circadian clock protein KaiC